MLVEFSESCVVCDVVGIGSHTAIDVDGGAVEGLVGVDAETVGHLCDKGAVPIDEGELPGFEAAEKTVEFSDSGGDNQFRFPGSGGFLKCTRRDRMKWVGGKMWLHWW